MQITPRIYFMLGLISCLLMLTVAAYFQLIKALEPCPLCISQRIIVVLIAIIMTLAFLHNPGRLGIKFYAILATISALLGVGVSARHVWLQHLPPEKIPECSPNLSYIFTNFPLSETLALMLNGTGECTKILWVFMGLSIPSWLLLAFMALAGLSLVQFHNANRIKQYP